MAYNIDLLNQICSDIGATTGHQYDIDAYNAICEKQGKTAGHKYVIDALNALSGGNHKYNIDALNALAGGVYQYEDDVLGVLGTKFNQQVLLTRNADLVEAGGYLPVNTSGEALSIPAAGRWYLNKNNFTKVRQNGNITGCKIYLASTINLTNIYFQIWRLNGTVYDLVSQYDVKQNTLVELVNTITFNTPIPALAGDLMGIAGIGGTATAGIMAVAAVAANQIRYLNGANPGISSVDFDAGLTLQYHIPMRVYMQAPLTVICGDSIAAGHPSHYSYIEESNVSSPTSSILYQLQQIDANYVGQNMGIGSQETTSIKNRFTADVVNLKPKIVILNGGVNDLINAKTKASVLANYTTMLDACVVADIIPVVCKITPWTDGTNQNMIDRDDWMTDLKTLVETYTGSVWVDADAELGQFRTGGSDGNLWNIKTAYNADNIHFNLAGYAAYAAKIDAEIKKKYRFV